MLASLKKGKEGKEKQRSINITKRKVEACRDDAVMGRDIKDALHTKVVRDIKGQSSECQEDRMTERY